MFGQEGANTTLHSFFAVTAPTPSFVTTVGARAGGLSLHQYDELSTRKLGRNQLHQDDPQEKTPP